MNTEAGNILIHDWMGNKRMKPPFAHEWIGQKKVSDLKYHTSWDWQVPVWGKVALAVKNLQDVESNFLWYVRLVSKYEEAIFQNKPEDGFKIICELLKWHKEKSSSPKQILKGE